MVNLAKAPKYTKVANFGCTACAHRWKSARAQPGIYQKCKHCFEPCYPLEFRWEAPNKDGNMNRETYIGHNSDLCGKCIELGHSCQDLADSDGEDIDTDLSELVYKALEVKPKVSQKERKRLAKLEASSKLIKDGLLDASNDKLSLDECIQAIQNPNCTRIKLNNSKGISDKEVATLASHLKNNTSVTSLNLASCHVGDVGASAIAQSLQTNSAIKDLILYGNPIGTEGLLAIASMIEVNTALERIDAIGVCDDTAIVDQESVYSAMLSAVKKNKNLKSLRLSYTYPQDTSSEGCKWMTLINAELSLK